ncbi:MG2 domain-containing protein [Rufibacter roseus]|uniref:MG2 domain-containing protein n=1 Tax=Rufibacter roseus TaxID=1567108 RepID=A0ABW2DF32_9BACT|nr:MG2 domain-containing protein [Rufibacter roseus]
MLRKNKAIAFALLFSFAALFGAFTLKSWQGVPVLEKIIGKLKFLEQNYPQEKVYLQTDKPYYAAGEDIWFKAYLVDGAMHTPSQLSQVLYVELINPQDSITSRIAIPVQNGLGHGDFALPDTISDGLYRIRAYTSWMQNFDENYFFHQNVNIYNPRVDDLVPELKFNFSRQEKGDSVLVDVLLKNTQEKPLPQTPFFYNTFLNRRNTPRRKGTTDTEGKAQLRFFLPDGKDRQNAQLLLSVVEGKRQTQKRFEIPLASDTLDVQFFPEGGNLVSGMWSTLGFKAIDSNGLGADIEGTLYDNTGKNIITFKSLKFGMGRISFFPEKGKTYEARIKLKDGKESIYALPKPQNQGVVMSVDYSLPDTIRIRAYLLGYEAANKPKALSVVGQSRGFPFFTGYSTSAKDFLVIKVPKKQIPTGVAQFTIFNENGTPLTERLAFINHHQHLQVKLTPDKSQYKPREKVTMRLQVKTPSGQPVQGNFSMAVTDAQKVEHNGNSGTILSNLLLTSDLRGHIEEPGYYFSAQTPEVALALDNLMLTQGWRRFVWQEILEDKFPPYTAPLERNLAISGTVQKLNGKPEPNALITVLGLGKPGFMLLDTANAQGKFAIGIGYLTDSMHVAVQARNQKGRNTLEVVLDKGLPIANVAPRAPYAPPPLPFSDALWSYLQNNRDQLRLDQLAGKSILLNSVEIRGKKQEEEEQDRFRSGLHSTADATIKGDNLPMGSDLISALAGRVAGLMVSGGQVSMRGGGTPLFLLDGMPIDADFIRTISMTEVEKVEILKPGPSSAIYGGQGGNGVIAVTLKRGGGGGATSSRYKGLALYSGIRYHTAREFYMPRYDQPATVEQPDLRTTIAWTPYIYTDSTGTAEVTFFAADAPTTYRAIAEGLSPGGQIGHGITTLVVR